MFQKTVSTHVIRLWSASTPSDHNPVYHWQKLGSPTNHEQFVSSRPHFYVNCKAAKKKKKEEKKRKPKKKKKQNIWLDMFNDKCWYTIVIYDDWDTKNQYNCDQISI